MKIVNIMIARGLGGIEQAFLDYNNALLAQGFDVLAITDKRAQINEKITPHQNLKQCKIRFSHLNLFLIWTFYRCFKKYQPDLIIVHSKKALELVIAAAKILGIKVVGVAHNPKFKHLEKCAAIFSITEHQKRIFAGYGFPADKIFVIPNLVSEPQPFRPLPPYHQPPVIGAVGRFDPMKGFCDYILALAELKKRGVPFQAVLGGGASATYAHEDAKIRKLITDNRLENDVKLLGWIKDKDEFYKSLDIFVLPSNFEPFGIVLLEAMNYSLPIVTSLAEGPAEIFADHKGAAYTFRIKAVNELADKLQYALEHYEQTKKVAENGYNLLQNNYTLPQVAKKLAAAVTSALKG